MIPLEAKVTVRDEFDHLRKGVIIAGNRTDDDGARLYLVMFEDSAAWCHESRVVRDGQMELR